MVGGKTCGIGRDTTYLRSRCDSSYIWYISTMSFVYLEVRTQVKLERELGRDVSQDY